MQNNLPQTGTTPQTSNPQDVGQADGATKGVDFQDAASQEVLSEQTLQAPLSVQDNGEPLPQGSVTTASAGSLTWLWWAALVVFAVVAGSILAIWFLKNKDEEELVAETALPPMPVQKTPEKRAAEKTKSGKPARKKRKNTSKKRR